MVLPPLPPVALDSFILEADWSRDGNYSHPLSDISSYMLGGDYRFGMGKAYEEVAPAARMRITLNNHNGDWSVGKSGSTFASVFKKGVLVRLRFAYFAGYDLASSTRFIGTISGIQLASGEKWGERTATLIVEDPTLRLQDAEYHPPLLQNVTADIAIRRVFDDAAIAFPYPQRYWMLGVAGASELGNTTTLFSQSITNFATGISIFPYTGDNSDAGNGVSALSFIRDVIAGEMGGRFYWNAPTGEYIFMSRQTYSTVRSTTRLENVVQQPVPEYHYADDLRNSIEISYELKALGTPNQILYSSPNIPITVAPGQSKQFTARYRDPNVPTARVGGINMLSPVRDFDYEANAASDGSGTSMSSIIGVSAEFGASSAFITISNPSSVTAYITLFQLRGTALVVYGKQTATASLFESVYIHGEFKHSLHLPLVESAEAISNYANTLVHRFGYPISRHERVTIPMHSLFPGNPPTITLTVGSTITYYDPLLQVETYPDGAYIEPAYLIVGEEGVIEGRRIWECTYVLEPAVRNVFWTLGVAGRSELDGTTLLAL